MEMEPRFLLPMHGRGVSGSSTVGWCAYTKNVSSNYDARTKRPTHKKKAEASPSDFILSLSDLQQVLPVRFGFTSRMHETHQMNASDPVNALLNYGYAILESQCRKALNSVGLEPTVGFLHEAKQTKYPLVYDLQEPYRWLVDSTVISCLENGQFGKSDFYRMDNYVLRLRPEAARKFIDALRIKFNSPIRYKGRLYGSDTVIRLKAQELANYILSRRNELGFSEPRAHLQRTDSAAVRNTILSLTASEARNLGIRKNTLWYLQRRVCTDRSMSIYAKVKAKLPEI
jgi:CRISPR-associated protein Cas1